MKIKDITSIFENRNFLRGLVLTTGSKTKASKELGISRRTLSRHLSGESKSFSHKSELTVISKLKKAKIATKSEPRWLREARGFSQIIGKIPPQVADYMENFVSGGTTRITEKFVNGELVEIFRERFHSTKYENGDTSISYDGDDIKYKHTYIVGDATTGRKEFSKMVDKWFKEGIVNFEEIVNEYYK